MTIYQLLVLAFGLLAIGLSLWAIIAVIRSPTLRWKPLWLIGSLFGFVGLGINWTSPDDLVLLLGITIPVVTVFKVLATGEIIVKTGFPVVAVVALGLTNARSGPAGPRLDRSRPTPLPPERPLG